jgi:hypothetical protein
MYSFWQKVGLTTFWAIFFTNSSGHTDGSGQGDQTGRILAYRALGSFWKITEVGHIFWQLFPLLHSFWQKEVGLHFGRYFFSNSSGHTDGSGSCRKRSFVKRRLEKVAKNTFQCSKCISYQKLSLDKKKIVPASTACAVQGCQIFLASIYQHGGNVPKYHKIYQMAVNSSNGRKIDQMSIKYTNIFHCQALQNLPELGSLVRKNAIWQPWRRT